MWLSMGRKLHINIKFEKTRLSDELLQSAYELVFPAVSRTTVDKALWDRECEYEDKDSYSKRKTEVEGRQ